MDVNQKDTTALEEWIAIQEKDIQAVKNEVRKRKGLTPQDDTEVIARHNNRSDLYDLYKKLSEEERVILYRENPEKWSAMMEAVRVAGNAALMATN